jgi:hypothetical protein
MTYILVIWTIIAATGGAQYSDYRPGEQLKTTNDRPFICLKKI